MCIHVFIEHLNTCSKGKFLDSNSLQSSAGLTRGSGKIVLGPRAGDRVLGEGQRGPLQPASWSAERYKLPQWGGVRGRAATARGMSIIFSTQDGLSY